MELDEVEKIEIKTVELGSQQIMKTEVRSQLLKDVRDKKINLLICNEVVNEMNVMNVVKNMNKSEAEKKELVKKINERMREFTEELCKIQRENCLYYVNEKIKRKHEGTSRKEGRNVVIKRGNSIIVKDTTIEDNLGESRSVNSKPPGEIEVICGKENIVVKQTRYSKWVHWLNERLRNQMTKQNRIDYIGYGVSFAGEVNEVERQKEFWDDMSGKKLKEEKVRIAREEEMIEVRKHKVYEKVPISECWKETGQGPIGTRWVDINKGDEVNEDYRSRLVAQELKSKSMLEDIFAATPPLEVKKMLFSMAVTEGIGFNRGFKKKGLKLEFIDVRRAYFHSPARREVYVKLPDEDAEEGMCGRLLKSMYGTRDAAQNWEWSYVEAMVTMGFKRGVAVPCLFYNERRNVRVAVHGDDFTLLGNSEGLNCFQKEIKKRCEVKVRGRIGPDDEDAKEIRLLNRVFEWGIEDDRVFLHVSELISQSPSLPTVDRCLLRDKSTRFPIVDL